MLLMEQSCIGYSELLAAKKSVPGGGGAAALVGALGVALAAMVGNFTAGKKKYADVEEQVVALIARSEELRKQCLALSDKDGEIFAVLAKVYSLPEETDAEKAAKADAMEKACMESITVPMDILRAGYEALKIHKEMGQIGNPLLISDIACGSIMLLAAMEAAEPTIYINLGSIRDEAYKADIVKESTELLAQARALKSEIVDEMVMPQLKK